MINPDRRGFMLAALAVLAGAGGAMAGHAAMAVEDARAAAVSGDLVLIDIRTPGEWAQSGVPDIAVPIDMRASDFLSRIAALRNEQPDRQIGLICATGGRSGYVADNLHNAGLDRIIDVSAGVHGRNDGWLARKLPVKRPE